MKKKIFVSMCLLAVAAVLLTSALFSFFAYEMIESRVKNEIRAEASLIAASLAGAEQKQDLLLSLGFMKDSGVRVTLIASGGKVIFDSFADEAGMENHMDRPEVQQAFLLGRGESVRLSETLGQKTLYHAQRLQDGSVLRLASTVRSISRIFWDTLPTIIAIAAATLLLALALARRLAEKIIAPINALNPDSPQDDFVYDELSPFISRIVKQNRQIGRQLSDMRAQRDRIAVITRHMREGLVLLDKKGYVLSVNRSAFSLLGSEGKTYEGEAFLRLTRSLPLNDGVKSALKGENRDAVIEVGGGFYHFFSSPVFEDGALNGAILLLLDVTEKYQAEKMRREFSANVSHELKTPLTSISGFAEMIESGMAKPADMTGFAKKIREEASRLVTLINDIIKLSRLDETDGEKHFESVDLYRIAEETAAALAPQSQKFGVRLEFGGDHALVKGNAGMLSELAFNLCDNAIKYNRPGGSVMLTAQQSGSDTRLTVSDTGIGIPKGKQGRIFERFYRVDKSHSRKTGGTGLGLSIVKHIAEYHGAGIELESAEGQGTSISVVFRQK